MKPQDCAKYSTCPKIDSLADRDMLDFQFADGVYKVCGECEEGIDRRDGLGSAICNRDYKQLKFEKAFKELCQRIRQLSK